jgi:Tfp pilus assembly PilM family ATPase
MFSAQASPIAIDFGSASVKLLQIGAGDRPELIAAAEVPLPDAVRSEPDRVFEFCGEWLPKIMRESSFKGRRAVIAVPSAQTLIQHMQLNEGDGLTRDDAVKGQLQVQMGVSPSGVVVRSIEVCPVHRNGQVRTEMICFAIAKDTVMRYVQLLKKCKLEVVGVHTDTLAMVRAFDHLHRRTEDTNNTTMYVDLGWGGTRVAITHGRQLVFARYIAVGGKHFDQLLAGSLHCDLTSARAHRLSMPAMFAGQSQSSPRSALQEGMAILNAGLSKEGGAQPDGKSAAVAAERRVGATPPALPMSVTPAEAPRKAVNVDMSELLDTMTDELSMCLRYHDGLFTERKLDRVIFVGGESRQTWLCQHLVKALRVPAQMGDPLARLETSSAPATPGLKLADPQPGWAVTCGLCTAPTDL